MRLHNFATIIGGAHLVAASPSGSYSYSASSSGSYSYSSALASASASNITVQPSSGGEVVTEVQFQAFDSSDCSGTNLSPPTSTNDGEGSICATFDQPINSFSANTDGCSFRGFEKPGCKGKEVVLLQGTCQEELKDVIRSVLQIGEC